MVREIREYKKFLERELKKGDGGEKLFLLHREKVSEFQHERLIHLIIMLFFIFFTIVFLGLTLVLVASLALVGNEALFGLLFGLDLIMTILSVAYVRHYYYLENLTQELYKYTEKLVK